MKKSLLLLLFFSFSIESWGQSVKIHTSDIDHFWTAYDSVHTTNDSTKQLSFIQDLYLNKATKGLQDFMRLRSHSATKHLNNILSYPRFWNSVRSNTLEVNESIEDFEKVIDNFKTLYTNFKQPQLYFTIGVLNTGGTALPGQLLIGAEIATANAQTEASELSAWLQNTLKQNTNGVLYLVTHEMVHTQQNLENFEDRPVTLLAASIVEGACDFITELLLDKPISTPYIAFGNENEEELWNSFQTEMQGTNLKNWLFNGNNASNGIADLGYFMGYKICQSYYNHAENKEDAIRKIIQLDYLNPQKTEHFLAESKYSDRWNR